MAPSSMSSYMSAGHVPSSAALTYCYYLLSMHPGALNRLLAEHDSVYGIEPAETREQIYKDLYKFDQVPFTTAAIK